MNDYMRALHQRFFREPAYQDVREEIEHLRRELREQLDRQDREKLLKLVDLGIELREETSLAAFTASSMPLTRVIGSSEQARMADSIASAVSPIRIALFTVCAATGPSGA